MDSDEPNNSRSGDTAGARSQWTKGLLPVLGSSGLISVAGPIVGELYWEGYLQAFGLQPEEFPASSARVAVHAYEVVVYGVFTVWLTLSYWKWYALAAVVVLTVGAVLLEEAPVRSRTSRLRSRLTERFKDRSGVGMSLRLISTLLALSAGLRTR